MKAPQGVHLVLAVGLSTLFAVLAEWWVTGRGPSWPQEPLALVYTLGMAFWAPWRERSHQGSLLKLWFWIVAALGLWVAMATVEGLPWPHTFALEGRHWVWFAVAFVQGQIAVLWAGQLASRARLFQLIDGVAEGRALEQRMRDFQLDADYSRGNHAALSASLVALGTGAVLLASLSPTPQRVLSAGLLVGFLVLCLEVGVLLRTYRREMQALIYGRRFTLADKLRPVGWSLVLAALAALGAWALLGLGGPWLDFSRLLPGSSLVPSDALPKVAPLPTAPVPTDGDYRLLVLLSLLALMVQLQHIGIVFQLVFVGVVRVVPWVVLAFLLWPLLRWVWSGGRETRGLLRRWRRLLRTQIRAFLATLVHWWRGVPDPECVSRQPSGARDWLRSFLGFSVSGRRPYPEVVEAFLTLVRWAEPLTAYRRGETTREFLDRLGWLVPDRKSDLDRVRDLLDQELFCLRGLDPAERKAFLGLVTTVTAVPPSHEPDVGVS